ncbi:MAG: metal ABC transporter ATP-binding protein, partial [Acidaminococcaceae bacterium]
WQKVGYVPQNPARQQKSFPISVEEVVSLGRLDGRSLFQRYTAEDRAAVRDIMERFNLMDLAKKKIGELSGGQQQRVFIARAMVNAPELLLLDEPATGVDPDAKEELYRLLGELNTKQGITIVMVSHDLELAAQVAKKALCLDHGICFWGNVQEALSHRHKHGYFYR